MANSILPLGKLQSTSIEEDKSYHASSSPNLHDFVFFSVCNTFSPLHPGARSYEHQRKSDSRPLFDLKRLVQAIP